VDWEHDELPSQTIVYATHEDDPVAVVACVLLGDPDLGFRHVEREVVAGRSLHLIHERRPAGAESLQVEAKIVVARITVGEHMSPLS
jgi:hypothetical protein